MAKERQRLERQSGTKRGIFVLCSALPCSKPSLLPVPHCPSVAEVPPPLPSRPLRLMSVTLLPVFPRRSSSLPISPDRVHDHPCYPPRHGSTVMVVADSTSPPSSPRQLLIRPELTVHSQPSPCSAKDSDHSPCISPPRSPPHSFSESAPDQDMDCDDVLSLPPSISTKPPVAARLLDDEEEHLHRSLRLRDFELRGTLGTYTSCSLNWSTLVLTPSQERVHSGASSLSNTVLHRLRQPIRPGFLP